MSNPAWYVVEAYEREVGQAYLRLAIAGMKVWAPIDIKRAADRRGKGGKPDNRHLDQRKRRDWRVFRFGRFFFVHCELTDEIWHAVTNQTGVYRIVSRTPVPDEQVQYQRENAPAPKETSVDYRPRDLVKIIKGPFASFPAEVIEVDKRGVLLVDVEIFGRSTPIAVEVEHVELVLPAKSRTRKTFVAPAALLRSGAAA